MGAIVAAFRRWQRPGAPHLGPEGLQPGLRESKSRSGFHGEAPGSDYDGDR